MTLRQNLARLLAPKTVAVVGANEKLGMSNNAVLPMLEAGREVVLVNPNRNTLYGRPAIASLSAHGQPVDAVLSLVNAERSIDVVAEAGALGCGGVIVSAAGFVEAGERGASLQQRLRDAAGMMAVVGPNCSGMRNIGLGVNLFTGGRLDLTAGGVGIVSQSGFLVRSAMAAAGQRRLGVSIAVSSGNEAVCDLADYVSVLADDPATSVICLVIETIRRPLAFFESVAAAHVLGKPVLALKLGRTDRARHIMQSHTGAIADASWVYDLAFREHGIIGAVDIDDLLDRAQLLAQLPVVGRRPIERIGMITTSGGVAALATDLAAVERAPLPPLAELEQWVRERVPGDTVNPLDLTGFVMTKAELMVEVFEKYAAAVDLLSLAWWTGDGDAGWSATLLEPFAAAAAKSNVPHLVTPTEATSIGGWVDSWRGRGLTFARGIQSLYRAVDAYNTFTTAQPRGLLTAPIAPAATPPRRLVASDAGPMVRFDDAMRLLINAGFVVAPYVVLPDGADDDPGVAALGERVVVKLADVAHRTELGAVRVGVDADDIAATVGELRQIAARHGVDATVAVQSMVVGYGEAFAGLHCSSDLGPIALFGRGGVLVESTGGVAGRFLPLDSAAVDALCEEVAGTAAFARLRGQRAWPQQHVRAALASLDRLWQATRGWTDSLDINPLIVTDGGLVAVDALFVANAMP